LRVASIIADNRINSAITLRSIVSRLCGGYTAKREQDEYTKRNRTSSFGVEDSICKTQKL